MADLDDRRLQADAHGSAARDPAARNRRRPWWSISTIRRPRSNPESCAQPSVARSRHCRPGRKSPPRPQIGSTRCWQWSRKREALRAVRGDGVAADAEIADAEQRVDVALDLGAVAEPVEEVVVAHRIEPAVRIGLRRDLVAPIAGEIRRAPAARSRARACSRSPPRSDCAPSRRPGRSIRPRTSSPGPSDRSGRSAR